MIFYQQYELLLVSDGFVQFFNSVLHTPQALTGDGGEPREPRAPVDPAAHGARPDHVSRLAYGSDQARHVAQEDTSRQRPLGAPDTLATRRLRIEWPGLAHP